MSQDIAGGLRHREFGDQSLDAPSDLVAVRTYGVDALPGGVLTPPTFWGYLRTSWTSESACRVQDVPRYLREGGSDTLPPWTT